MNKERIKEIIQGFKEVETEIIKFLEGNPGKEPKRLFAERVVVPATVRLINSFIEELVDSLKLKNPLKTILLLKFMILESRNFL